MEEHKTPPKPRYVYDPAWAAARLDAALAVGTDAFLVALREIIDLHGVIPVAKACGFGRQHIYRHIRAGGNPDFVLIQSILNCLQMPLAMRSARAPTSQISPPPPAPANANGLAAASAG